MLPTSVFLLLFPPNYSHSNVVQRPNLLLDLIIQKGKKPLIQRKSVCIKAGTCWHGIYTQVLLESEQYPGILVGSL